MAGADPSRTENHGGGEKGQADIAGGVGGASTLVSGFIQCQSGGVNRLLLLLVVLGAALWGTACGKRKEAPAPAATPLSDGYSLLAQLLGKEAQVGMVLMVKTTPEDVAGTIRDIAEFASKRHEELKKLAEGSEIVLNRSNLPKIEVEARAAIEKTQVEELLKRRDREFAVLLLNGQVQGLDYMKHLCDVLAAIEKNGDRKEFLEETGREAWKLRGRAFGHLCP